MRALQVGDIAPHLVHPDAHGSAFDLAADHIAGRFWVLVFCQGEWSAVESVLKEFASAYDAFQASGAGIVGVCAATSDGEIGGRSSLPFPLLLGVDEATFRAFSIQPASAGSQVGAVSVLLRPNGHVLDILSGDAQATAALAILTRSRATDGVRLNGSHAPVLIVPDVLSRADCQTLIAIYRDSDAPFVHFSEIRDATTDVKTQIPDYERRDRIDHRLNTPGPRQSVARTLQRRLLPEIKKAFQYDVTTFEGLRIACYEGERQGRAQGHRDNSRPEVAHRRFAMSLNLNSEQFSGGELRFPEYGSQLYKPDTGAAIVFSCSILHEALEVTEGRRFVLLAFFC
jgi:peroxiredoxin/predicted 2-oxoglutarate/Fe(II)-dependent dioxygenase YbiX